MQPCTTQPAEFPERPCPEPARSRSPQRRRPSPHPAGSTLPVRSAPELEFDSHTHTYTHTLSKEEVAQDHGKALLVPPLHWFFLVCFKGMHGPLAPPWTVSRRLGHCTPGNQERMTTSQTPSSTFLMTFFFLFNAFGALAMKSNRCPGVENCGPGGSVCPAQGRRTRTGHPSGHRGCARPPALPGLTGLGGGFDISLPGSGRTLQTPSSNFFKKPKI